MNMRMHSTASDHSPPQPTTFLSHVPASSSPPFPAQAFLSLPASPSLGHPHPALPQKLTACVYNATVPDVLTRSLIAHLMRSRLTRSQMPCSRLTRHLTRFPSLLTSCHAFPDVLASRLTLTSCAHRCAAHTPCSHVPSLLLAHQHASRSSHIAALLTRAAFLTAHAVRTCSRSHTLLTHVLRYSRAAFLTCAALLRSSCAHTCAARTPCSRAVTVSRRCLSI